MLNQKQKKFKSEVINFAESNLSYDLIKNDKEMIFNLDAWRKCAEYGVHGWIVPKRYGGSELDVLTMVCGMEGLGYSCLDDGLLFGINAHTLACAMPILNFGSEEQKQKYLPDMCQGDVIASHSATEPLSGSDIYGLTTRAERRGSNYIINGDKHYVTNGAFADIFIVFANTNPSLGEKGISGFIIHRDTPGLIISPLISTMGDRTAGIVQLKLRDCVVSDTQLLGTEGMGNLIFSSSMEWERGFILSRAIGSIERLLDKCLKYVKSHKQFGQPIGNFQFIVEKIVNMRMHLENARYHVYSLARKKEEGKTVIADAARVNLYVSNAWVECSMNAMEIYGGNGYVTENGIERELRNAIGSKFYSGTTEMQKIVIAKFMGL